MPELQDIYSTAHVEVEQAEKVEEVKVEESANAEVDKAQENKPEAKEDAKAEESKAESTKEEPTPSEDKDVEQAWTKSMALDERKKRQDTQKELDILKASIAESEQVEAPDVFDDQAGFAAHYQAQTDSQMLNQKVGLSRMFMMDKHDDYQAMEDAFMELAETTPGLREQAAKHEMPAKFVYEQGQKSVEFKKMQDVGKYKDNMRAEIRAELEAEMSSTKEKKASITDSITPSLANARESDVSAPAKSTLESVYKT